MNTDKWQIKIFQPTELTVQGQRPSPFFLMPSGAQSGSGYAQRLAAFELSGPGCRGVHLFFTLAFWHSLRIERVPFIDCIIFRVQVMSLYIGHHEIPTGALSALVKRSYSTFSSKHVTPLIEVRWAHATKSGAGPLRPLPT